MPPSTDSITIKTDLNIIQARLAAVCPPCAKRPHYQDGYLVGRYPQTGDGRDLEWKVVEETSKLERRLVACIPLLNKEGKFWDTNFPIMTKEALMPADDPLKEGFEERFGPNAPESFSSGR